MATLDYDIFDVLDSNLRAKDVILPQTSTASNGITSAVDLGNLLSGSEVGAVMGYGKKNFSDTQDGWLQGFDSDGLFKFIIGDSTGSIDWNVTADGTLTITGAGIVSPTLSYGKTSFSDSTHAGYWISSSGFYVGSAADASKMKYTVATGTFDFIGTVSSRSTATLASAINASGNLVTDVINANLDTSAKSILAGFDFGSTDYAGAVKSGNITWNTSTGAITGGSGVVVYRSGIVGAASGVTTFSIDATTGNATFSGVITSSSGNIGGFTIGATTLSATNLTLTSGLANVANIAVGTGSNLAGLNSGNSSSDIAFWAGSTFANRSTAPFRVTMGGLVTVDFPFGSSSSNSMSITDNRAASSGVVLLVNSSSNLAISAQVNGNKEVIRAVSTAYTTGSGGGIIDAVASGSATGPALRGEALGESAIELKQGGATSTNFYNIGRFLGGSTVDLNLWISNNTSPDGTLTASKGSFCLSDGGKAYVNDDGSTSWKEVVTGNGGDTLVPVNAAQDLSAGECVSLEAGGLYRTRATGLSSEVAAAAASDWLAGSAPTMALTYKRRRFLNMSPTVKCSFIHDNAVTDGIKGGRFVVNPTTGTVTSVSTGSILPADCDKTYSCDAVKLSETVFFIAYIVNVTVGGAKQIRCKVVTTTSGLSAGAEATSAETVDYNYQLAVERISNTEAVVFYTDGTDLKAQYVTVSGTTCTFSTVSTIRSSAVYAESVCKFGDTNYYCFIGSDASPAANFAICGTLSAGSFSMGTETAISSNFSSGYGCATVSHDDGTIIMANTWANNYNLYTRTITRSGSTLTVNSQTLMWNNNLGYEPSPSLNKLGPYTYSMSASYLSSGNYEYGAQLFGLSGTAISTIGSILTIEASGTMGTNQWIVGPGEFCGSRLLCIKFYDDGLNEIEDVPINLSNNLSTVIGIAAEDISSGSQGKITLNGLNQEVSGLTAMTSYYGYLDGQTTSDKTYGCQRVGMALNSTCLNVKITI